MKGFGHSPPQGRRAAPRTHAPLVVELSFDGTKHLAVMDEVSRTGAKLSGVRGVAEGQELLFKAGRVEALGEVVWSQADQCAIAFDIPIAATEVARLLSLANFVKAVENR